ncbi:hypothetical protein SMZ96_000884 [Cronobacter muytjensii]|nr:hypothetical protein [Cronobacter muytjensii]
MIADHPGIHYWCRLTLAEQLALPVSVYRAFRQQAIKRSKNGSQHQS